MASMILANHTVAEQQHFVLMRRRWRWGNYISSDTITREDSATSGDPDPASSRGTRQGEVSFLSIIIMIVHSFVRFVLHHEGT
jgi:hypothetical protein